MKIIRQIPNEGGAYPAIQEGNFASVPESCALWPDSLSTDAFYEHNGFVTLEVSKVDGTPTVTSYMPNLDAWEAWKASQPPEEPEIAETPTEAEQLRADVDYIAAMTGVTL